MGSILTQVAVLCPLHSDSMEETLRCKLFIITSKYLQFEKKKRTKKTNKQTHTHINQRTNGPINAHLIYVPRISTKHLNLDKKA